MLRYKQIIKMVKEAGQCRQFDERDMKDEIVGRFYQSWLSPLTNATKDNVIGVTAE